MNTPSFVISDELAQMFLDYSTNESIQLSPLQTPSFEETGRLRRVKEHVSISLCRYFGMQITSLSYDGATSALVAYQNNFALKFYHDIADMFGMEGAKIGSNELSKLQRVALQKLAVEFQEWVKSSTDVLQGPYGKLVYEKDRLEMVITERPKQLEPEPGRVPAVVTRDTAIPSDPPARVEAVFEPSSARQTFHPDLFVPSDALITKMLSVAGLELQIAPNMTPSFDEEGRIERTRARIVGDMIGLISIMGHTFGYRGVDRAKWTRHDAFNKNYVKAIAERFNIEMPINPSKKVALKMLHDELRQHLKTHHVGGDWGEIIVDDKNEIDLLPAKKDIPKEVQPKPVVDMFPYKAYRGSRVWMAVAKALRDLEKNQDIELKTERKYVTGYISKILVKHKVARHSKGVKKQEKKLNKVAKKKS